MKNYLIILLLFLSVGFSQQLIKGVDTDEDGTVKITYYKETQNGIEIVKYEGYHKNGQKSEEGTFKDGKEDGKWTYYYQYFDNGKKKYERTYKDDELDGIWTSWYDNGQKMKEGSYKDGEEISSKCWDEDGNEIECD